MTVKTGTTAKAAQAQRTRKGSAVPAAAKTAARTASKKGQASPAPVEAKPGKTDKPKKIRMVRDSFTMPENDYAQIAELKKKCLQAGVHVKKSELLRAGLAYLAKLQKTALLNAVGQVEKIKTGRPAKS